MSMHPTHDLKVLDSFEKAKSKLFNWIYVLQYVVYVVTTLIFVKSKTLLGFNDGDSHGNEASHRPTPLSLL